MLFGCAAGLTFAIVAWGIDAVILAQSHTFLPLFKFFVGTPVVILIYGLAGYFSVKSNTIGATLLSFGSASILVAILAGHLPYEINWRALQMVNPQVATMLYYPFHEGTATRLILVAVIIFTISVLVSFFFDDIVSPAYISGNLFGAIIQLILFVMFFAVSGWLTDDLINRPLRNPISQVNILVQQAQEIQNKKSIYDPSSHSWVDSILRLEINVNVPYRIITETYDITFSQLQVLVQFDQDWYRCYIIDGQPFYCEPYIQKS